MKLSQQMKRKFLLKGIGIELHEEYVKMANDGIQ
jgi:hypothetical protein